MQLLSRCFRTLHCIAASWQAIPREYSLCFWQLSQAACAADVWHVLLISVSATILEANAGCGCTGCICMCTLQHTTGPLTSCNAVHPLCGMLLLLSVMLLLLSVMLGLSKSPRKPVSYILHVSW